MWKSRHFLSGHDAMIEGARIALEVAIKAIAEPDVWSEVVAERRVRALLAELDAKETER